MKHDEFFKLEIDQQLEQVFTNGQPIAHSLSPHSLSPGQNFMLYKLYDFYVELYFGKVEEGAEITICVNERPITDMLPELLAMNNLIDKNVKQV